MADWRNLGHDTRETVPETVIIVDGVCAAGGVEESMDAWDVDVIATGAREGVSVRPGLTLLAVSRRPSERCNELGETPAATMLI